MLFMRGYLTCVVLCLQVVPNGEELQIIAGYLEQVLSAALLAPVTLEDTTVIQCAMQRNLN